MARVFLRVARFIDTEACVKTVGSLASGQRRRRYLPAIRAIAEPLDEERRVRTGLLIRQAVLPEGAPGPESYEPITRTDDDDLLLPNTVNTHHGILLHRQTGKVSYSGKTLGMGRRLVRLPLWGGGKWRKSKVCAWDI